MSIESSIMSYGGGGGDGYDCWNMESVWNITKLVIILIAIYFIIFFVFNMDSDRKSVARVSVLDEQLDKLKA